MEIEPITPDKVESSKKLYNSIILSVNELIFKYYDDDAHRVTFTTNDLIRRVREINPVFTEIKLRNEDVKNIEYYYTKAGWNVKYEIPTINEKFDSFFIFMK